MDEPFDNVYEFEITLRGVRPPVWRTIQVPDVYTFWDLHVAIQSAMGWDDCHLHVFRIGSQKGGAPVLVGLPDDEGFADDPRTAAGWDVPVGTHLRHPGDRAHYEYDFGDGWEHDVVLKGVAPRDAEADYPRCIAGNRACPPEDCGGPPGYARLLKVLADPDDEEYEDTIDWLGDDFDPERFDPAKVFFEDPTERLGSVLGDAERESNEVRLEQLLDGSTAPVGAMSCRQALGFLFAVANAPELVPPSEWLPLVLGGSDLTIARQDQLEELLNALLETYNDLCSASFDGLVELPPNCWFYEDVLSNFDDDAPMRQWCSGFLRGHGWLMEAWEEAVPDPDQEQLSLSIMSLGFFASRRAAEGLLKAPEVKVDSLEELAEMIRDLHASAMVHYAQVGQTIHRSRLQEERQPRRPRTGRNDPCPCGSGKKFKKCCLGPGSTPAH